MKNSDNINCTLFQIHPNLGEAIVSQKLRSISRLAPNGWKQREGMAFISFFHNDGWEKTWFPILMNGRHLKFDDHFIMEICREKFGHTKFGISDGQQASLQNAMRDNL